MSVPNTKEESRERVKQIVNSFRTNEKSYTDKSSKYNETQVRTDYITPLLEAFGWDVYNKSNRSLDLRDVIEESTVEVGEEKLSKKPDYEMRVARQRKFFVEAKKPSVNIGKDISAAFQVRRYGFSASLPISVLTNFKQLSIYDCFHVPSEKDQAHVARITLYSYEEYESKFDEIYERLSRESVYSGQFDEIFLSNVPKYGSTQQFDGYFLRQVRDWRVRLAQDIHRGNQGLSPEELTYIVQLFLSRIVFLRICEDRNIENYQTLKDLDPNKTFDAFMVLLEAADKFYDSGLFDLFFDKRRGIKIGDETLKHIIEELYYPQSPYTFAVVEAGVLGEIYEMFLGEIIQIDLNGQVEIIEKPEVRESGGVVPTPQFIVNDILDRALYPLLQNKTPADLENFTVADICCGSGVFLLGTFDVLLNYHLDWYMRSEEADSKNKIYESGKGQWRLQFEEKRKILLNVIRGVDIDSNAVEIAKFSLFLKLIENETAESLAAYSNATKQKVLPKLDDKILFGNSLIEHALLPEGKIGSELANKISPFTWKDEFPNEMNAGGFDVIVGNPPYIRIQNMMNYSADEVKLYTHHLSPYITAKSGNYDKYALFIERSLALIKHAGSLGLIVPNKFMTTTAGKAVRNLLTQSKFIKEIVHFGAQQVFGKGTLNYTCTIILNKQKNDSFSFERVENLLKWRYGQIADRHIMSADEIGQEPWAFCSASASIIFERLFEEKLSILGGKSGFADIFVGVQTSNDSVYIFSPTSEEENYVVCESENREWRIERDILRPCLHDVPLHAYETPKPNKYMIFPYDIVDGKANLIPPDVMENSYPEAWSYLNKHKDVLAKRNIMGGKKSQLQWYQFGRSQSLTKFSGAKIILPILSLEPKYSFDEDDIVVTGGGNGPYYLVRPQSGDTVDLYFLLAILCHPVSEALIRARTSVFQGGYYSHGKQYIESLPIPVHSLKQKNDIADLVRQVIAVSTARDLAVTPKEQTKHERNFNQLKKYIEQHVTALYGLTDEEMIVIRDIPVPA
jgi:type I restriction-modification system DNA methylase subunit